MSLKNVFEKRMEEQKLEIARQTVRSVLEKGIPSKMTMEEVISDLQEDSSLWQAFLELTFGEFRGLVGAGGGGAAPAGPCRKRGVTAKRIIEYVAREPGAKRAEIMKALGLKGGTSSSQLRTLRSTGRLRGEGEERNLSYYVP